MIYLCSKSMRRYSSRMTEIQFKEIYSEYKSSGLSKGAFCTRYGYTRSSFYSWLQKWGDVSDIKGHYSKTPLTPIVITGEIPKELTTQGAENLQQHDRNPMELEITHPTGLKIMMRGVIDIEVFKTLLNQF